ncbi:MAG: hypothetical protein Q9191_006188, partial [Dirinaria sp. TL-2023a]
MAGFKRAPDTTFANLQRHSRGHRDTNLGGAIHREIVVPVVLHGLFAALIVFLDEHHAGNLGLPASIIPSLSIVVGLMLVYPTLPSSQPHPNHLSNHYLLLFQVFRNQTSYNRFWDGRNYLTIIITSVRNLTRSFLACSHPTSLPSPPDPNSTTTLLADSKKTAATTLSARADTERAIRILIAILYAVKNHLRADWGATIIPGRAISASTGTATLLPEYSDLLPQGLMSLDDRGLGLPLQLTFLVEMYIRRGFERGWFHGPQASMMQAQLNTLVDAFGRMETIRLTSVPVAHL